MKKGDKRGQVGFNQIILGILVLFIVIVGLLTFVNYQQSENLSNAITESIDAVSSTVMDVAYPLFNVLLGLNHSQDINFLVVLTFILVSIIIVGTLDSVNIFGSGNNGNLINFAVGIIVAIIGVRFMPSDMWISLTAPSSAFVATILVAVPFLAMFFVSMKIKYPLAQKALWLFYVIFMTYLIFFNVGENSFAWIYGTFLVLGILMLFFESIIRRYFSGQKYKYALAKSMGMDYNARLITIEAKITELNDKLARTSGKGSTKLRKNIEDQIDELKSEYKDITGKMPDF